MRSRWNAKTTAFALHLGWLLLCLSWKSLEGQAPPVAIRDIRDCVPNQVHLIADKEQTMLPLHQRAVDSALSQDVQATRWPLATS